MLNKKHLVGLTEHQKVCWRLIKVENWDNNETYTTKSDFTF